MFSDLIFYAPIIGLILAISSLFMAIIAMYLLSYSYIYKFKPLPANLQSWIWPAVIGITIGGTLLSLVYSEIFLIVPCSLYWLQRIALYPQVLLTLMAFRKSDTTFFPTYGIGLSIFGFFVSTYHYIYQMLPEETRDGYVPCLTDGSVDCADKIINYFGFVTFPFISMMTFALLIALYKHLRTNRSV